MSISARSLEKALEHANRMDQASDLMTRLRTKGGYFILFEDVHETKRMRRIVQTLQLRADPNRRVDLKGFMPDVERLKPEVIEQLRIMGREEIES